MIAHTLSLRARLALLVSTALIPVLSFTTYTSLEQRRLHTVHAEQQTATVAALVSTQQRRLIDETRILLADLAHRPEVLSGDSASCNALFGTMLQQHTDYSNLVAFTPTGDMFCSGVPTRETLTAADRPWFQRVLAERDFVFGSYAFGAVSKEAMIPSGYPVLDQSGRLQAVVGIGLKIVWIAQLASQLPLPAGTTFSVLDSNGLLLARYPNPEGWVGRSLAGSPLVKAIQQQGWGTIVAPGLDGVTRIYAFAPVGGTVETGAYISIGIPEKEALAEADQSLYRNLVVMGVLSALAIGTSWALGLLTITRPTNALVRAARRLAAGDLSARTGLPHGSRHMGRLAQAFDEMASVLERLRDDAVTYQKEQKTLAHELLASRRRLQAVSHLLLEAQEAERRSIARELHDELGQLLTGLKLSLELVPRAPPELAHLRLAQAQEQVNQIMARVRDLSMELRPHMLDDLGLLPALTWHIKRFSDLTRVTVALHHSGLDRRFSPKVETAAYRIVQEALTNVARHSSSSTTTVRLWSDGEVLGLQIEDRGAGFDPQAALSRPQASGLAGMRERALLLGGHLQVDSAPGAGTRVTADLPLDGRLERRTQERP